MILFLAGIIATVALIAFALLAQDVVYYFRGYGSRTGKFVERRMRRRARHVPCSRIRVRVTRGD